MKNLLILLSISFIIFSCQKENSTTSNNSSSFIKSMVVSSTRADVELEFASYYSETEGKYLSFKNAAYFSDNNTEANVTFGGIEIAKLNNHYENSPYSNENSTNGYIESSTHAIGQVGTFNVAGSSTINDFSSDIYIPIAINATYVCDAEGIQINWNIDPRIDNNIFGVLINYTPNDNDSKDVIKYYQFNQNEGSAIIPISDLFDAPSGAKINLTYARGVYFDEEMSGKIVRTFAYTYGDGIVFKN